MKRFLMRLAAKLAMRKPAPARIPLSDMIRVRQRDYFVVNLGAPDDPQRFLVRKVRREAFTGLWFHGSGSESEHRTIPNAELPNYNILITHYFGELEIRYSSPLEFILKRLLRYEYVPYWRERIGQYLFNRRSLDEKRRIQVLRLMLDSQLSENPLRSAIDVMSDLYGQRWAHHPQHLQLHEYYNMMLHSFVEGGELTRTEQHGLTVAPKALNTLDAYSEDERRHNGNMSVQRWMLIVTAMVGVASFVQAYSALFPTSPATP